MMLAHDMGQMTELGSRGRGLTDLTNTFLPLLTELGVDQETQRKITVDNLRRWLSIPDR